MRVSIKSFKVILSCLAFLCVLEARFLDIESLSYTQRNYGLDVMWRGNSCVVVCTTLVQGINVKTNSVFDVRVVLKIWLRVSKWVKDSLRGI